MSEIFPPDYGEINQMRPGKFCRAERRVAAEDERAAPESRPLPHVNLVIGVGFRSMCGKPTPIMANTLIHPALPTGTGSLKTIWPLPTQE
jgi:hypothetical protein